MKPITALLELIKSEHGQEAQDAVLEKIGKVEHQLKFVESFIFDKRTKKDFFKSDNFTFVKLNALKNTTKVFVDAIELLKSLTPHDIESLKKSLDTKDWSKISKRHSQDAAKIVDHAPHKETSQVPQAYKDILSSNEKQKGLRGMEAPHGITSKMVHKVPTPEGHDTYMTKTYHRNPESATKSWVKAPILGWATMATKSLFNAAGIGHMAEDVHTHEHEGVPTTVHKFAKDFENIASNHALSYGRSPVPFKGSFRNDDLQKISIMDYLTNNNDRHAGNLMYSKEPESPETGDGMHNLLAVDHERNFQYHKPVNEFQSNWGVFQPKQHEDRLRDYKNSHGLKNLWRLSNSEGNDELHKWWTENSQKMSDEMLKQVSHIKDEHTRKHVWDNFKHRMDTMNNWAENYGNENYDDPHQTVSARMIKDRRPVTRLSTSLKMLNKDNHLGSVETLINLAKKHGKPQHRESIDATFKAMLNRMTPQQVSEIYQKHGHDMLGHQRVDYAVLNHLRDNMGQSKNAKDSAKALLSLHDSQPEGSNFILPFWQDQLRQGLVV
jgi:hypothetical protein